MRVHESAHCSTSAPLSPVVVYPHLVMWLLKSPIKICGRYPYTSAVSTNFSCCGLYTECTNTPGISIEISSTLCCSYTEAPFTFRSLLMNSATIFDVGSLNYDCHFRYLRPCNMWCSMIILETQTVTMLSLAQL